MWKHRILATASARYPAWVQWQTGRRESKSGIFRSLAENGKTQNTHVSKTLAPTYCEGGRVVRAWRWFSPGYSTVLASNSDVGHWSNCPNSIFSSSWWIDLFVLHRKSLLWGNHRHVRLLMSAVVRRLVAVAQVAMANPLADSTDLSKTRAQISDAGLPRSFN